MLNELSKGKKQFGLIDFMISRVTAFSIFDWGIFKICLISFGVLLGTLYNKLFKKLAPLVAVVFIATWVYMLWRVLFCECDD